MPGFLTVPSRHQDGIESKSPPTEGIRYGMSESTAGTPDNRERTPSLRAWSPQAFFDGMRGPPLPPPASIDVSAVVPDEALIVPMMRMLRAVESGMAIVEAAGILYSLYPRLDPRQPQRVVARLADLKWATISGMGNNQHIVLTDGGRRWYDGVVGSKA